MENLAYLQAVLALESPPEGLGCQWETVNWPSLSGPGYRRWLTIALSLSLFSLVKGAIAAGEIPTYGLARGDSGPLVTCVQQMLQATGYFHGPVSGFYGPMTEQAVLTWELESAGVGDGAIQASTLAQMECYQRQSSNIPPQSPPPANPTPITEDLPTHHRGSGTIRRGDRGESVVQLQQELIAAGYFRGPVTGYYGALTEDAVMRLQRDHHIRMDGVVTRQTLLHLTQMPGPVVTPSGETLRRGSQGSSVVSLQENLRYLGYYTGPITGYYGQLTQEAVLALQRDRGITADGIAGPQTQNFLVSLY